MEWLIFAAGVSLGWWGAHAWRQARARPGDTTATVPVAADGPPGSDAAAAEPSQRAWSLARELESRMEQIEDVATLERQAQFGELVACLGQPPFDARERANLATSQTLAMSCAALAALAAQRDSAHAEIGRTVGRLGWFNLAFALRYLAQDSTPSVAAAVLSRVKPWWLEHPATRANLRIYLDVLATFGLAQTDLAPALAEVDDPEDQIERVRQIGHPVADTFAQALRRAARARDVARAIEGVGRWLDAATADEDVPARTPEFDTAVATLIESIQRPDRTSLVTLGEPGCGKTTLIRTALRELSRRGWRVLEATAEQIVAGQKYVGEIEQRIETLIEVLSAPQTLWFAPACHTLLERGAWSGNPNGLLDSLMPALESHRIQLVGESERGSWTRVLAQRPRVAGLIRSMQLQPADPAQARALILAWADLKRTQLDAAVLETPLVHETMELARQHFPDRVEPGRSLELLQDALTLARADTPPALPLTRDLLLAALSKRSGIPLDVLDIERRLDIGALRAFFESRVMGQTEAVDCLVDRIAMLKAGLTDPRRPLGVFLFAGPTGTGKTEIAKALAELLFGHADRLLRLDMSEYQGDDAANRLIDDGGDRRRASLTTRIREQPFSVVLLDEFEKAHPRVWDLFLQVFDDGRLTDRAGSTVSFRHAIVILTSNLGATIDRGGGPGFVSGAGGLSRAVVQRAIDATFRREFINRIDRVVIFAPLARAVMRDVLHKELRQVLARRGFQVRDWAVEWQPSAIEFLLEKGFTPDLGARPLRRAIEHHVLAPLARSIVEHRAPQGEQFLFVSSDGDGIEVRFVDPDAPPDLPAPGAAPPEPVDLRALALDPRANQGALSLIREALQRLEARVADRAFVAHRERAAAAMQSGDFWARPERVRILDRLERIDRIEAGMRSAHSLLERLARLSGRSVAEPLRRLALLAYVLDEAVQAIENDEPEHVRLAIESRGERSDRSDAWRRRLLAMYQSWSRARGMRASAPRATPGGGVLLEIGGFGAWRILRHEAGLHVLDGEHSDEGGRLTALVEVTPEPEDHAGSSTPETRLVRRYADGPGARVRDSVRGWKCARPERVFEGDFDLILAD